jgi:hypothetical protein
VRLDVEPLANAARRDASARRASVAASMPGRPLETLSGTTVTGWTSRTSVLPRHPGHVRDPVATPFASERAVAIDDAHARASPRER